MIGRITLGGVQRVILRLAEVGSAARGMKVIAGVNFVGDQVFAIIVEDAAFDGGTALR